MYPEAIPSVVIVLFNPEINVFYIMYQVFSVISEFQRNVTWKILRHRINIFCRFLLLVLASNTYYYPLCLPSRKFHSKIKISDDQLLLTYGISYFSHCQHKLHPRIKLRSTYFSLLFQGGVGTHEEMGTNSYGSRNQKVLAFIVVVQETLNSERN